MLLADGHNETWE